ncbi:MAG: hypothetical protein U0359_28420 [Byssovorax sp.]
MRETCLGAYAHQGHPLRAPRAGARPERDLSRSPLLPGALHPPERARAGGGALAPLLRGRAVEADTAKFDLTLVLNEGPGGLHGSLEYNADIFDASTIDRLIERFGVLLQRIGEPETRWSTPSICSPPRSAGRSC